jgi:hypothetical protein
MIRIRYTDLPEGLFARAEAHGRHTVIYLRPGLTPAQRKEGLRRARQTARMGHGPRLPAAPVQAAVAADRVRLTLGYTTAAVRQHLLPSLLLAGVMAAAVVCYVLFVSVSIRFIHPQPAQAESRHPVPHPAVAPFRPVVGPARRSKPGPSGPGRSRPAAAPSGGRGSPAPGPTSAAPRRTGSGSPAPSSSQPPGPSPSPSPTSSGVCLVVGPLGVCLQV